MPTYSFTAIDAQGRQFSDTLSATNLSALESLLQAQGSWLVKARPAKAGSVSVNRGKAKANTKLKRWELINFYTQLGLLLDAGVTLSKALTKLSEDLRDSRIGPVIHSLAYHVEAGTPLPQAMAAFPKAFSNQAVALIEAGEASGKLPESLATLANNLEWMDGLVASARQALIYPMAICAAAVGLVILLFTVVVPRFEEIFQQLSTPLPKVTVVVLALSEFFATTWYLWGGLGVCLPLLLSLPGKFPQVAELKDRAMLKVPFLGELAQCLSLSQFSVTLEMLIKAGIPLARALELCSRQSGNALINKASSAAKSAVTEGRAMSDELAQHPIFTQTFITMVQTGERSGQLDITLQKVGQYYNTIVPRKIKAFFSFFEPAIIVTLTSVVGTVALALVLPIMQLWDM
ncbi:type II secretion system F family protein [Pelagicoccus sp. SDUM812003]|uniref:type II secretion system F family protein n=1 Tax=Pelagicoccus sp. SDUM812003 TaxID=3041267 RepID=UPI00280F2233|nr:type II secretion system F family protein [Pelagicoccus sp. SDUM812003]MDQ8203041.1 type II secretion system F family protein [Pelagicoccus sp. SDUM812003]